MCERVSAVPSDTLLHVAITRATWGLSVVEPNPRRFVQHYVIGREGRQRKTSGEPQLVYSSLNGVSGERPMKPRRLHNALVLVSEQRTAEKKSRVLDMARKHLYLVPQNVLNMHNIEELDLSVNDLRVLPTELWDMPLRVLNLSHNPCLGRVLLSALKEAKRCTRLQSLLLRDVVPDGAIRGNRP